MAKFHRNVFYRGQAGYERVRRATVWCERVPDRHPEIIVGALNADDVVAAVLLARDKGLRVSVRSGGHSWNANHLRDGVLLIDCHGLQDYHVDPNTMTGWAQPGLRGSDLNQALMERGLYFPTGHCSDVCIGGYLLQGGVSYDNHRLGPACGSVTAIDVVTANGEMIHSTDDNEHAELLWAARGAGPGFFGLVTRFYVKLYPRRQTNMKSTYVYPSDSLEDVQGFCHDIGPQTPTETASMMCWEPSVSTTAPIIGLSTIAFTDTEDEARGQLSIFENCPARSQAIVANVNQLVTTADERRLAVDPNCLETKRYAADNMWTAASIADLAPGLRAIVNSLQGLCHVMFTNFGCENPPPRPPMAFSLDDKYYYGVYAAWDNPADDQRYIDWLVTNMRALEPYMTGIALADENLENRPFRFMTEENLKRLDQVRAKYDPENLFVPWANRP
jgi:FAD/FMN-containing dehydrogenase